MSKTSSFLKGVFFGAAVGSFLALIFTPKSGEEIRKDLQEKADQIVVEVKKAAEQKQQELEEEIQ